MIESPGHVLNRIITDFGNAYMEAFCGGVDFMHELQSAMRHAHREWIKLEKRCRKHSDPKWQRRYAKALKRSRRNVAHLKRIGRCR